jgi:pyrroloquinoline quinone (PQQ) biosynthesis protein C
VKELAALRSSALERLKHTEMFGRIARGGMDKHLYACYLINVYHYAQHSPKVIALAGSRCANSHPALAAYLMHHATEEIGHEKWAHSDLKDLGWSEDQIASSRPGTSCTAMVGMEYFVAGHWNPVALFGWLFALEAFGDDVGHLVSKKLDSSLGLRGKASYFLAGHGDADHDHIREITTTIEEHMRDPKDVADTIHIATVSCDLYIGILDEVVRDRSRWA